MECDSPLDNLLDCYGLLELAHDRVCSSIVPKTNDKTKFDNLRIAVADYQRAIEAFMAFTLSNRSEVAVAIAPHGNDARRNAHRAEIVRLIG